MYLKQQTINNLESKQQNVNQFKQKLDYKIESLKTHLKDSKTSNSNKNNESSAELDESIKTKSENTGL